MYVIKNLDKNSKRRDMTKREILLTHTGSKIKNSTEKSNVQIIQDTKQSDRNVATYFVVIAGVSLILERKIGINIEKKRCLYNSFILA